MLPAASIPQSIALFRSCTQPAERSLSNCDQQAAAAAAAAAAYCCHGPSDKIPQATFSLTIFLDDSASADLFRRFIYIAVNFMNISTRVFYFVE